MVKFTKDGSTANTAALKLALAWAFPGFLSGDDLEIDLPLSPWQVVLGAEVRVEESALADLIHQTVDTVKKTGRAPGRASLPYAYYGPWFGGFGFFHPFGWLFGIGFFLFFFFMIGGLFRMLGWRRWAGHGDPRGPTPPWADPQRKEQSSTPGEEKKQE